jgi:hypothetical protein
LVRKGPSGPFGIRSSRPSRYLHNTLNIVDKPPTEVGTGFMNCLPFRRALSIIDISMRLSDGCIQCKPFIPGIILVLGEI